VVFAIAVMVRAQQPMPVVGFLDSSPTDITGPFLASFREGLSDSGYVEGANVAIEYRSAMQHYERLPALAAELVQRHVAAIAAHGVALSALASKAATFAFGGDPVLNSWPPRRRDSMEATVWNSVCEQIIE
jgi:putative tryptophan/tyrosine transport system substrate-binding protein